MKFIKEKVVHIPSNNGLTLEGLLKIATVQIGLYNPSGVYGAEKTTMIAECKKFLQNHIAGDSPLVNMPDVFWGRPESSATLYTINDFAQAAGKLSYRVCSLRHVLSVIGAHRQHTSGGKIFNEEKRICCVPLDNPLLATHLIAVIVNDYEKNRSNPHQIVVVSESQWRSLRTESCLRFLYERLH
jgi:hypothetical protein